MLISDNITERLVQWGHGDEKALQELIPLVYSELHRLAARYLKQERPDHTLQATALVHEAYLQVQALHGVEWKNRAHFIGIAANTMRRILIDNARKRRAHKRAGFGERAVFEEEKLGGEGVPAAWDVLTVDQLLTRLEQEYPRQARVVELRFFGGLTTDEATLVLQSDYPGVSTRTVERDWRFARAQLHLALTAGGSPPSQP